MLIFFIKKTITIVTIEIEGEFFLSIHITLNNNEEKRKKKIFTISNKERKDKIIINLKGDIDTNKFKDPVYTFNIDTLNPTISLLSGKDIEAINAGVCEFIEPLTREARNIIKEKNEDFETYQSNHLLYETIERVICSWDYNASINAQNIERFLKFNRTTQIVSLDDLFLGIEEFKRENKNKPIILNLISERLHTNKKRLLTYLILNVFQNKYGPNVVISESYNYLWRDGHFKLFLNFFDIDNNELYLITSRDKHLPKHALMLSKTFQSSLHIDESHNEENKKCDVI